jgi:hypothetical protein
MLDIQKMKDAAELLKTVDQTLFDSGLYDFDYAHSVTALRDLIEDLDIDIARAEDGTLADAD